MCNNIFKIVLDKCRCNNCRWWNNWGEVLNVIQKVLTSGTVATYGGGSQIVTATVKGQTVQVVIKVIDGVMRIVDAWVKS